MEVRTLKISSKRQITIPKSCFLFKEGGSAILYGTKDKVVIKPLKEANEAAILSEKLLAECWNSKEDEEAFKYLQE